MRPSVPPATTTSFTAARVTPPTSTSSVESSTVRYSPSVSSTPQRPASDSSRATASLTPSRSIVTTAARSTDRIGNPPFEVGWELRALSLDEVEDELTVSLRAGQSRVYAAVRFRPAREQRLGHLVNHAPLHRGVADDALRRVPPSRLELRLHEHEGLPAGRGEREHGGQRVLCGGEGHIAHHELRRERQLGDVAGVDAFEDDHARVVADLRMQLAVADVERDHARGATLEQHVGEAARRGADVDRIEAGDVETERVERVRELVSRARDVRRGCLDLELGVLVHLLARLLVPRHTTGHDERLRLRARLREAALDEEDVKPLLGQEPNAPSRRRG